MHLETPDDDRFARFAECLTTESRWADEIYLLGDIVEMWIGDDDDSALAQALSAALKAASDHAKVFLLHGNRDFLFGAQFATQAGVAILPDPSLTEDRLLVSHGDALCTDDQAYQNMRALFRSEAWQQDILGKTLAERQALGAMLRAQSQQENSNKAANIMDVNAQAVSHLLADNATSVLIHGHTHRPGMHVLDHGQTRWVLGAWERCGWLLRQLDGNLQLECFSLVRRYGT